MAIKVAIGISTPTLNDERFKKCYDLLKRNTTGYFYEMVIFEGLAPKGEMFHYTRATNTLFKAITDADYYVVINSDVYVEPHWLEPLIETAQQDPKIGIVGVMTVLSNNKQKHGPKAGLVQHGGGAIHWNSSSVKLIPTHIGVLTKAEGNMQQRDCAFVTGCLSLFTKECIKAIGMKDERILAGFEDIEYCLRAWENGFRVVYQPKSKAEHDAGTFNSENKEYTLEQIYYDQTWSVLKDRWTCQDIDKINAKVSKSNKKNYIGLNKTPKKQYRNLVITTGYNRILFNRWLPRLRNIGKYSGDVLIVDYGTIKYGVEPDLDKESLEELKKQPNVFIRTAKKQLANIFIDRVRVYREWLLENERWRNYDVILILDGNDVIFHGPIEPLLQMGYERICYATEHFSNHLKLWGDFSSRKFIQNTPKYKAIEEKPIINGGMIIGPTGYMMDLLNYQSSMIEKYGDGPSDQLLLCLYIYVDKQTPAFEVGQEWNYTYAVIGGDENGKLYGPRQAVFRNGKAYMREDDTPIVIEHRTGTGYWFWRSKEALEILNSKRDITMTEEYDKGTNYFSLHFPNTPEFLPTEGDKKIDKFIEQLEDKVAIKEVFSKEVKEIIKEEAKEILHRPLFPAEAQVPAKRRNYLFP
jgi:hypothetical protein